MRCAGGRDEVDAEVHDSGGQGHAAAADGSLGAALEALIEQVEPAAAYFTLEQGQRAGMVIFEESDQARLTTINEPLFAQLDAAIEIVPVLTIEDLRRGLGRATP